MLQTPLAAFACNNESDARRSGSFGSIRLFFAVKADGLRLAEEAQLQPAATGPAELLFKSSSAAGIAFRLRHRDHFLLRYKRRAVFAQQFDRGLLQFDRRD